MGTKKFIEDALSEWMRGGGTDADIVISSRIRLARNIGQYPFPMLATDQQANNVLEEVSKVLQQRDLNDIQNFEILKLNDMDKLEKRVLVEKHLISPNLANDARNGGVLLSENEAISIMINEEDHLRIQCLSPGLQLDQSFQLASEIDDVFEQQLDYAFDEKRGYLTSCSTNVGTGLRASVMLHLPALVLTQQINRILSAVNQVGLTVRGIYGEGSEAIGNLFQVSNQITLGQSEEEIIENLYSVVKQIIEHERSARATLLDEQYTSIIDRSMRSYGILSHAHIIDSKEAAQRLSDIRLGIDLGMITNVSANILNELMVMTQPGFLQTYAGKNLNAEERDIRRAEMIREHIK
ncbi:protein arginine kinase [Longirhabdus pacifica]|uniref:protein arginine kinase n=1 Tax=Longirhabdus pacifica TaxID=2305227 RepID=UPI001008C033|nr:protein arginine kinase [Longirhabdus pacifica]